MSTFSVDAARALNGPAWLQERRVAAAQRANACVLPSPEEEIWRYSRIAELDLARFVPVTDTPVVAAGAEPFRVEQPAHEPAPAEDLFDELNVAFGEPIVLRIPAGRTVPEPIVIEHRLVAGGTATFPALVVEAGADAEVTVVQRFVSDDGIAALVVPTVDIRLAPAARVSYLGINQLGRDAWMIANQRVVGERDSVATIANVSLGGEYARVRTDARVAGIGAETRQIALYFADGTQMHDFRTLQQHQAPKTSSDLLFKGAVHDTSRSVYTGLIRITPEAKGSTAYQTNRNLTLSAGAWAESVPNLEIETNDVKCSHASTVGPVDPEQRFYLESRGVPPEIAEQLILLGFFDEVINQLPAPAERAGLRLAVAEKLARHRPTGVPS